MRSKSSSVAVIIPAYNAAATIGRAVRSALTQPEVAQCIVVDDASQDDTAAAAGRMNDGTGRLQITRLETNAGPSVARNLALDESRSDMVCVLDADDYFVEGRLSRLLGVDMEYDFLADNMLIVPEERDHLECLSPSAPTCQEAIPEKFLRLDLETFVLGNVPRSGSHRSELGFLKPIMRRAFLEAHGLRYQPQLRFGEDYAFYVQALAAGARFLAIEACGYVAVERSDSLTSSHSAADLCNLLEFDRKCLRNDLLGKRDRAALELHLSVVQANATFRQVLNARSERGLAVGIFQALRRPYHLPYMISEALTAKWRSASSVCGPSTEARGERYLLDAGFWSDRKIQGSRQVLPRSPLTGLQSG